jgi:hypothetical protein
LIQTLEIHSKPGFVFTAEGGPNHEGTVEKVRENQKKRNMHAHIHA